MERHGPDGTDAGTPGDGGSTAPPATGVDPSVPVLGPDEVRETLARAADRDAAHSRFLRAQADLDNFRRREAKERRAAADEEAERVLAPVLALAESLRRAVEASATATDAAALRAGVEMGLRELERALGELGVERIGGEGAPLDPATQQAILSEPTDAAPPLTVLAVLASGWRRGERILRPAMVKVAAPKGG
jgi:molecular chaperone GrpE